MPKKKVYTITEIVDAFYNNAPPKKIVKMAQTLLPKRKRSVKTKQ